MDIPNCFWIGINSCNEISLHTFLSDELISGISISLLKNIAIFFFIILRQVSVQFQRWLFRSLYFPGVFTLFSFDWRTICKMLERNTWSIFLGDHVKICLRLINDKTWKLDAYWMISWYVNVSIKLPFVDFKLIVSCCPQLCDFAIQSLCFFLEVSE